MTKNRILQITGALLILAMAFPFVRDAFADPIDVGGTVDGQIDTPVVSVVTEAKEKYTATYTDNNLGENLIIKTSSETYGVFDKAEVLFSVQNTSLTDQNVDIRFLFEGQEKVLDIQELVEAEQYEVQVPVYETQKGACVTVQDPCDKQVQIGTSTETHVRDRWQAANPTKQVAQKISQKPLAARFKPETSFAFNIPAGKTYYFKALVDIPNVLRYRSEFVIEAYGDLGGFGQLDPWFDSGYLYCQKWTAKPNGTLGGAATTSSSFSLAATGTIATLAATSSGGHIQKITGTGSSTAPVDIVFTSGTDCNTDSGSIIPFYTEDYIPSTGAFSFKLKMAISSTSSSTVLVYYSNPSGTDQSSRNTVYGNLAEAAVYSFGGTDLVNVVTDSATSSKNGVLINFAATTTSPGMEGQALRFNGAGAYVSVSGFPNGLFTADWSQAFWMRTSLSGNLVISEKGTNNAYIQGLTAQIRIGTTGTELIDTGSSLNNNAWHHIVATYNTTTNLLSVYVDGALSSTKTLAADALSDASAFVMGARSGGGVAYPGSLDDWRIYLQPIHAMDVKTIYNNTNSSQNFWTFSTEETMTPVTATNTPQAILFKDSVIMKGNIILKSN